MYKRVIKFLDKHNILSESQFGFRKKLSRNLSIMELVERISKAIDDKEYTMGVFLDLWHSESRYPLTQTWTHWYNRSCTRMV